MFLMYKLFRNNPSQSSLDPIIKHSTRIVSGASTDIKGTGINADSARAFSNGWLSVDDSPILLTNKHRIDQCFNEILSELDNIEKYSISEDARAIYLHIIQEYAKKIKRVYQL